MAEFSKAYLITLADDVEGIYSNDPADPGGETLCGIARNYHPEWEGWALVDQLKNQPTKYPPQAIAAVPQLQAAVRSFYTTEFWNKIHGDYWSDQRLANQLFDSAVNLGAGQAIGLLQQALNMLNWNQKRFPDIEVDGGLGAATMSTVSKLVALESWAVLADMVGEFRSHAYLAKAEAHPEKERFIKGWLARNRKLMAST